MAEIGFEIIVVHITCNIVPTPFRVLVDMSEAVRTVGTDGGKLDLRVHFQGATLLQTLDLSCPKVRPCPADKLDPADPPATR